MAEGTKIEWADHTFNGWIGCTKVGPGCDHCYAEVSTPSRAQGVVWGPHAERRRTGEANWQLPLRWQRNAKAFEAEHGRRQRVFAHSLSDVFDNAVPASWRVDLFRTILATPDLDWLLVTKRIGNVPAMLVDVNMALVKEGDEFSGPTWDTLPPNVWLGITVVNQEEVDRDVPKLLAVPARVRFLSVEPLLGPVDLTEHLWGRAAPCESCPRDCDCECGFAQRREITDEPALHWVIAGGESGPKARPSHTDWYRALRDQCAAAGVPFLFKQWGEWGPDWEGAETCHYCGDTKFDSIKANGECGRCGNMAWEKADKPLDTLRCVGKKAAGRLLDGVTHDGFPAVSA